MNTIISAEDQFYIVCTVLLLFSFGFWIGYCYTMAKVSIKEAELKIVKAELEQLKKTLNDKDAIAKLFVEKVVKPQFANGTVDMDAIQPKHEIKTLVENKLCRIHYCATCNQDCMQVDLTADVTDALRIILESVQGVDLIQFPNKRSCLVVKQKECTMEDVSARVAGKIEEYFS